MKDLYKFLLLINVINGVIVLEAINIFVFGIDGQIFIMIIIVLCLAGGIPIGAILKGRGLVK